MQYTHRVRAILYKDSDHIYLIKRVKNGQDPYWVTPGGGVEEMDTTIENALIRELQEELGASIEIQRLVFVLERQTKDDLVTKESFFLCRLIDMDEAARTGPEFSDSSRGEYILDEILLSPTHIQQTNIKPEELKQFVMIHCHNLTSLPDLRDQSLPKK